MTKPTAFQPSSAPKPPAPVLPAASVVIMRDGKAGIETFMLVRQEGSGMAFSGAFVFPGGKVDRADSQTAWKTHTPDTPEVPDRCFWIAAVRETFEEAGLLLARIQGAGTMLDAKKAHAIVKSERQARVGGRETEFIDLIAAHRLTLAVDQMIHFGHWITPEWAPRRFDTHFFLVAAPVTQTGLFDEGES
jgi:8-oxo-dGTP pyrophosphatase MutT (NUDIX family)